MTTCLWRGTEGGTYADCYGGTSKHPQANLAQHIFYFPHFESLHPEIKCRERFFCSFIFLAFWLCGSGLGEKRWLIKVNAHPLPRFSEVCRHLNHPASYLQAPFVIVTERVNKKNSQTLRQHTILTLQGWWFEASSIHSCFIDSLADRLSPSQTYRRLCGVGQICYNWVEKVNPYHIDADLISVWEKRKDWRLSANWLARFKCDRSHTKKSRFPAKEKLPVSLSMQTSIFPIYATLSPIDGSVQSGWEEVRYDWMEAFSIERESRGWGSSNVLMSLFFFQRSVFWPDVH